MLACFTGKLHDHLLIPHRPVRVGRDAIGSRGNWEPVAVSAFSQYVQTQQRTTSVAEAVETTFTMAGYPAGHGAQ